MILHHLVYLLTLVCCLTICACLLFYRRQGSRFKRHYGLVAWLLIVGCGSLALLLLTGEWSIYDVPTFVFPFLVLLCFVVLITRGNVARIIRLRWYP